MSSSVCPTCVQDETCPGFQGGDRECLSCIRHRRYVRPILRKLALQESPTLETVLDKIRSQKRRVDDEVFDCLLGLSGGLDSSYLLHLAVTKFGLKPLVFHVNAGWDSPVAVRNIQALVSELSINLKTTVVEWDEVRRFQLAWFKSGVPHIDIPQDHAFVGALYNLASSSGIKTILNGGNLATEGVQPPKKYFYYGTDMRHIRAIRSEFGAETMPTYPFSSTYRHKIFLRYLKGLRVEKPLDMIDFKQEEAAALLSELYGWSPYGQKHFESEFTKFYEGYWLPTRFGFDIRRIQLSSLILSGQITREQALLRLQESPLSPEEVVDLRALVSDKLRIDQTTLDSFLSLPLSFYDDYPNSDVFLDAGARILRGLRVEPSIKE